MSIASALGGLNRKKKDRTKKKPNNTQNPDNVTPSAKRDNQSLSQRDQSATRRIIKQETNTVDSNNRVMDDAVKNTKGNVPKRRIELQEGKWYLRLPRINKVLPELSEGFSFVSNGDALFVIRCKKLQIMPAYILKDTYLDTPEEIRSFCLPIVEYDDSLSVDKTIDAMKKFYREAYNNEFPESDSVNENNHQDVEYLGNESDNQITKIEITNGY